MRLKRRHVIGIVVITLAVVGVVWFFLPSRIKDDADETPATFVGDSSRLKQTIIVPTLDSPLEPNKSAIWCATLQLAWKELQRKVRQPIQLQDASDLAQRLNSSQINQTVFAPQDYFADAGPIRSGIIKAIRTEMGQKFPDVRVELDDNLPEDALVAFAYCSVKTLFKTPYIDNRSPLQFRTAGQASVAVKSFGTDNSDERDDRDKVRKQMSVLYQSEHGKGQGEVLVVKEFLLDLDHFSKNYQVLVARIDREATLQASVDKVARLQREYQSSKAPRELAGRDEFLMPQMSWDIEHHESKLHKPILNNPGLRIADAYQRINFRLTRKGVELKSISQVTVVSTGAFHPDTYRYICDRPFFVVITKRGQAQPCFVMWVENAELLTPW